MHVMHVVLLMDGMHGTYAMLVMHNALVTYVMHAKRVMLCMFPHASSDMQDMHVMHVMLASLPEAARLAGKMAGRSAEQLAANVCHWPPMGANDRQW